MQVGVGGCLSRGVAGSVLATLVCVVSVLPCSWAAEGSAARAVLLDTVGVSDQFAKQYVAELEEAGVKEVDLYHTGEEIPEELRVLAGWITSTRIEEVADLSEEAKPGASIIVKKQIKVIFHRVSSEEYARRLDQVTEQVAPRLSRLVYDVEYFGAFTPQAVEENWFKYAEQPQFERTFKKEMSAQIRNWLGIRPGLRWLYYKVKKGTQRRKLEMRLSLARAPIHGGVMYLSLASQMENGRSPAFALPIAVNGLTNFLLDYHSGGNSDFMGQGNHYDFIDARPSDSVAFFGIVQLIHSIILRQLNAFAAHGADTTWSDVGDAAQTTALGWVTKLYPERFAKWMRNRAEAKVDEQGQPVSEKERVKRERQEILWFQFWRTLYPSLNLATQFGQGGYWGWPKKALQVGALVFGVAETVKRRKELNFAITRDYRKITGQFDVSDCRTLLVPRAPVPNVPKP